MMAMGMPGMGGGMSGMGKDGMIIGPNGQPMMAVGPGAMGGGMGGMGGAPQMGMMGALSRMDKNEGRKAQVGSAEAAARQLEIKQQWKELEQQRKELFGAFTHRPLPPQCPAVLTCSPLCVACALQSVTWSN